MATAKKDYAKIAREKMYRPASGRRKKPKLLIYARNKKGKTRFCTTAPNVLIADPEYGADTMESINPHVWPIEKWEDIDDFYKYVRSNPDCPQCGVKGTDWADEDPHKFEWVALDGLTRISNMSLKFVMMLAEERDLDRQPGLVQQRDYGKSGQIMKDMLTNFHNLDMGVIYTAHERQDAPFQGDEDEDTESAASTYVPDLPKGVRGAVNGLVDVIGRLYVVNLENDDGVKKAQRRLWIGPSVQYDTGVRSDFVLPDMVKVPTVSKLVRLMAEGEKKKEK